MNGPSLPPPPLPRVVIPHGGNLDDAVRRFGIAREQWLDLSTGINPDGYPVPTIDPQAWLRLPDDDDDLEAVAAACYGAANALAVAGTQAAIRMLPQLLSAGTVGISALTYGEYGPAFEHAGFPVDRFVSGPLVDAINPSLHSGIIAEGNPMVAERGLPVDGHVRHVDVHSQAESDPVQLVAGQALPAHWRHLVIVNPNNPTTEVFDTATLLDWHAQLVARGGYLIVDEAFADATPAHSIAFASDRPGLIVLRSVGKFFGLAGARAGFMLAERALLETARLLRGPWTVTGPARAVVRAALLDTTWQQATRAHLPLAAARLAALLEARGLCVFRTTLFAWTPDLRAAALHNALAKTGIWVRYFDRIPSLRFGLPSDESGWAALQDGLQRAVC